MIEHLPLTQVMIMGPGIEFCVRLPGWSLLLPLPMSLPLSGYLKARAFTFGSSSDPESWNQVPHQTPQREPASPSAYVSASLCVSLMNKYIKS